MKPINEKEFWYRFNSSIFPTVVCITTAALMFLGFLVYRLGNAVFHG